MEQQNLEKQLEQLNESLVKSQSRSFELIANMTEERDAARSTVVQLNNFLKIIADTLGMENPTAEGIVAEVTRLAKESNKTEE